MKLKELHDMESRDRNMQPYKNKIESRARQLLQLLGKEDMEKLTYLETDQNYITLLVKSVKEYVEKYGPTNVLQQFLDTFTPDTIASIGEFKI